MSDAAKAGAATALLAAALFAVLQSAAVNQDTIVLLDWGRDLANGRIPDYDTAFAPTPHPLTTVVLGIFSLFGQGFAYSATVALSYLSLRSIAAGGCASHGSAFTPLRKTSTASAATPGANNSNVRTSGSLGSSAGSAVMSTCVSRKS